MLVSVPTDRVLTVTAEPGGYGIVWHEGTERNWPVGVATPLVLPAGLYRVETVRGVLRHSVDTPAMAALNATLPRAIEIVRSGAIIAAAINRGNQMSIQEKFARLAERAKAAPAALADRADTVFARLDAVESRAGAALDRIETAVVNDAEAAAAAIEDAANQLTNQ